MEAHLREMNERFQKLAAIGEERLSESWKVPMTLLSLLMSYNFIISALEMHNEADLTTKLVQSKLLEEYHKRNVSETTNAESIRMESSSVQILKA